MARGGTGKQCANSLNGLAAATNHPADISPSKLQLKDGRSAVRNFREDHVVRKFDQLPNNEFEKLSHAPERLTTNPPTHNSYDVTGATLPRAPASAALSGSHHEDVTNGAKKP